MLDGNLAAKRFLQGVRQFTNLFVIQGAGGGDFGGYFAAPSRQFRQIRRDHVTEGEQAAVQGDQSDEILGQRAGVHRLEDRAHGRALGFAA